MSSLMEIKLNDSVKIVIDCSSDNLGKFAECDCILESLTEEEFYNLPCKDCFMNTKEFLGSDLCDYPYFKACIRKKLAEFCKGL